MTAATGPSELALTFAAVGQELASLADRSSVFTALSAVAVRQVPGAELAGITIVRDGSFKTVGATSEAVERIDRIQYELRSGPCVDAVAHDTVFRADDLRVDRRWPEFGERAFEAAGVISMLSLRLFIEVDDRLIAGLNMYASTPAAFDDSAAAAALVLATHGSIAVSTASAKEKAANLEVALNNSREIGIAMGIVMNSQKVTRQQAFDLLRMVSQHTHRKLNAVAAEVAETGQLPHLPGHSPSPPPSR